MKWEYVCLGFQSINVVMNSNQLNVLFKYKPKKNARLLKHYKMTYFHLECQNPIKNIK